MSPEQSSNLLFDRELGMSWIDSIPPVFSLLTFSLQTVFFSPHAYCSLPRMFPWCHVLQAFVVIASMSTQQISPLG